MKKQFDAFKSRAERYEKALKKIVELDPEKDSKYGFNEWGEADCFVKAQEIAKDALSARVSDSEQALEGKEGKG